MAFKWNCENWLRISAFLMQKRKTATLMGNKILSGNYLAIYVAIERHQGRLFSPVCLSGTVPKGTHRPAGNLDPLRTCLFPNNGSPALAQQKTRSVSSSGFLFAVLVPER